MLARGRGPAALLMLVGLLCSLALAGLRHRSEARNRAVGIVLDEQDIRLRAAQIGISFPEMLERVAGAGATGIALTEPALGDLIDRGSIRPVTRFEDGGLRTYLRALDPDVARRLAARMPPASGAAHGSPGGNEVLLSSPDGAVLARAPGLLDDLLSMPAGIAEEAIVLAQRSGLQPVARLLSPAKFDPAVLKRDLDRLHALGVRLLIFAGDEVPGNRTRLRETAGLIAGADLLYGDVEMGKQRGAEKLAAELVTRLVRVHSVAPAEMDRLSPGDALERYVRSAAERNIRLLYVRFPDDDPADPAAGMASFIRKLRDGLRNEKLVAAQPHPFELDLLKCAACRLLRAGAGAGVGAACILLLAALAPAAVTLPLWFTLVAALLPAAAAFFHLDLLVSLTALAAAIVYPALGMLWPSIPIGPCGHAMPAETPGRVALRFLWICLVTLAGGLAIAGLLATLPYLLKVKSFTGIKAATLLPLLVLGAAYTLGLPCQPGGWGNLAESARRRVAGLGGRAVQVWHLVLVSLLAVGLALLVMRSGNEPGVGVSGLELKFRSLLDQILQVRPRTKEFAVGHPALLFGLFLAARPRWRAAGFLFVLAGAIGQVGMLNSFCHLHSPLMLTLIRSLNGLWVGALPGMLAIALWLLLLERRVEQVAPDG